MFCTCVAFLNVLYMGEEDRGTIAPIRICFWLQPHPYLVYLPVNLPVSVSFLYPSTPPGFLQSREQSSNNLTQPSFLLPPTEFPSGCNPSLHYSPSLISPSVNFACAIQRSSIWIFSFLSKLFQYIFFCNLHMNCNLANKKN